MDVALSPEREAAKYGLNIRKLNAFSFFWMFLVVIPVIAPLFLSFGLSMQQFFKLQAIFGLSVALLELPTGYICDLWGRKLSILIGSFISGVAFTYLIFAQSYSQLVVYEIVQATALCFVSGADVALLYDSMNRQDRQQTSKSLANQQFFALVGESVASILGGLLVVISFQCVTIANALAGWVPFFIALTLYDPKREKVGRQRHGENLREVFRQVFLNNDKVVLLAFFNLVVWGLSSFIAVWIIQKYWADQGISLAYFGFIWAALNLTAGIVGKQVHWLERRFGAVSLIVVLCWAPICGYFGMSWVEGVAGVAFCFLFYVGRGISQVLLRETLNWRIPSNFRATVNSLQSLFFRLGFAMVGPAVGFGIDHLGMARTLQIVGGVFIALFLLLARPLIRILQKLAIKEVPVV
ncbi:MAG: MFS transporter [Pseudomonadota bacterium]